jgi:hypothetical protein
MHRVPAEIAGNNEKDSRRQKAAKAVFNGAKQNNPSTKMKQPVAPSLSQAGRFRKRFRFYPPDFNKFLRAKSEMLAGWGENGKSAKDMILP